MCSLFISQQPWPSPQHPSSERCTRTGCPRRRNKPKRAMKTLEVSTLLLRGFFPVTRSLPPPPPTFPRQWWCPPLIIPLFLLNATRMLLGCGLNDTNGLSWPSFSVIPGMVAGSWDLGIHVLYAGLNWESFVEGLCLNESDLCLQWITQHSHSMLHQEKPEWVSQ